LLSGSANMAKPMTPSLASSCRLTARDPRNSFNVDVTLLGGMLEAKTRYSAFGSSGATFFQRDFMDEVSQTAIVLPIRPVAAADVGQTGGQIEDPEGASAKNVR
jgi:hypothetical protein